MTKIQYVHETWNPITGCTKISPGCQNCYAERMAKRMAGRFGYPKDDPFEGTFHRDKLDTPKKWKKPRRILVCSMGDIFLTGIFVYWIEEVLKIMASNPHHKYLLLTKRPWPLESIFLKSDPDHRTDPWEFDPICNQTDHLAVGVTAENQMCWDSRTAMLKKAPVKIKWVSIEPILDYIDMGNISWLSWVVVGGETGRDARETNARWIIDIVGQCDRQGVPVYVKGMGAKPTKHEFNDFVTANRQIPDCLLSPWEKEA